MNNHLERSGSRIGSRFCFTFLNLRDKDPGVLAAVDKNIHAIDVSGTWYDTGGSERAACAVFIFLRSRSSRRHI